MRKAKNSGRTRWRINREVKGRKMGAEIADILFGMVRWGILHLSDRRLAQIVRIVRRLAYAFTGDEEMKGVLGEVVGIFETGPPGTDMVRKMLREAHRPYAADMVRGFPEI